MALLWSQAHSFQSSSPFIPHQGAAPPHPDLALPNRRGQAPSSHLRQ
jgi:hypothetical protein